jgi:hypothetical protein
MPGARFSYWPFLIVLMVSMPFSVAFAELRLRKPGIGFVSRFRAAWSDSMVLLCRHRVMCSILSSGPQSRFSSAITLA